MRTFIGIDCGISGAVASIDLAGHSRVHDLPRHATEHRLDAYALAVLMRQMAPADNHVTVFVERVHARAGGGGMHQMGSMMQSVGVILGAIDCCRWTPHYVTPVVWKRFFGLLGKEKADSLALARRLYPDMQPALKRAKDDGRAEALLVAHYGLAVLTGSYTESDIEDLEEMPF